MSNDARNILGLYNKEEIDTLVSKEDGMSYIRGLNRVRSKQDILLESDSLEYQLNSIMIANEALIKDTILESERLDLVKELMVSENGISLENANDIMDSYIEEGAKWDNFINAVKERIKKIIELGRKLFSVIFTRSKGLKESYPNILKKVEKDKNIKMDVTLISLPLGIMKGGSLESSINKFLVDSNDLLFNSLNIVKGIDPSNNTTPLEDPISKLNECKNTLYDMKNSYQEYMYDKVVKSSELSAYEFCISNKDMFDVVAIKKILTEYPRLLEKTQNYINDVSISFTSAALKLSNEERTKYKPIVNALRVLPASYIECINHVLSEVKVQHMYASGLGRELSKVKEYLDVNDNVMKKR